MRKAGFVHGRCAHDVLSPLPLSTLFAPLPAFLLFGIRDHHRLPIYALLGIRGTDEVALHATKASFVHKLGMTMAHPSLTILDAPKMPGSTLLLALTGWMDGGLVSTGTVKHLMDGRDLTEVARIDPAGFYIDNFPGSMELTALFRPSVKYEGGLVTSFEMPSDEFYADPASNMAFFLGKEPNINWVGFAQCIFEVVKRLGVTRIIFMGSFGGTVPHTREPRLFGSVSDATLLPLLKQHGLRPSDYEGPGSFATYLLTLAPQHGVEMLSISAEIPGYLEGVNPLSIEAVARRLSAILNLPLNLAKLREQSNSWEAQVSDAVQKDTKLAKTVRKLETQYDNELIATGEPDE